ncbi:MAG: hypothetical protein V4760_07065 [Bdellovibrionota bacterium]
MVTLKCFNCGTELSFSSIVGRRDECTKCGADVHACRNCAHYDRASYNECKETAADRVQEKDRANFCDHYTPGTASGGTDKGEALRAAAEALFKKK